MANINAASRPIELDPRISASKREQCRHAVTDVIAPKKVAAILASIAIAAGGTGSFGIVAKTLKAAIDKSRKLSPAELATRIPAVLRCRSNEADGRAWISGRAFTGGVRGTGVSILGRGECWRRTRFCSRPIVLACPLRSLTGPGVGTTTVGGRAGG